MSFSSEECSSKGGTYEGSCASGFGVCCSCKMYILQCFQPKSIQQFLIIVALSCGGSSSDNNTYLVQTTATSVTSPCTYTICPCNQAICRTRFDFAVRQTKYYIIHMYSFNCISLDLHSCYYGNYYSQRNCCYKYCRCRPW